MRHLLPALLLVACGASPAPTPEPRTARATSNDESERGVAGGERSAAREAPIAQVAAPDPAVEPGEFAPAAVVAQIRRVSPHEVILPRAALDAMLEHMADVLASTRVTVQEHEGRAEGIRLDGVQPTDVLRALGFENGDIVRTVGGYRIDTPDGALEAYSRLRDATRLPVTITRASRPLELVIHIEP